MAHDASNAGLISFANPAQMTRCLTALIAMRLELALRANGKAVFAVSGGSTPRAVYEALSTMPLDWAKVCVVLVDERWVEEGKAGSNASFVRETLLQDRAMAAGFVRLKTPDATPAAGAAAANMRLAEVDPPDVVVLGMGNDGHTASWFPHAEGLKAALAATAPKAVAVTAQKSDVTGEHLERMTLSLPFIRESAFTVLMMQGAAKRNAYEVACQGGDVEEMPVRALLADPPAHFWPCWAE